MTPRKRKLSAKTNRAGRGSKITSAVEPKQHEVGSYRTLLDYYLRVYLDTRQYLRRSKQRLGAMDKNTVIGKFPREEEWGHIAVYERHKQELKRKLAFECEKNPDHEWMRHFSGVGVVAEAALLSRVDIEKADTVSSLWRFCGLGVEPDGKRQRLIRRTKRNYCSFLKAVLIHHVGTNTLISKRRAVRQRRSHVVYPQYRVLYEKFKKLYTKSRPDWTKAHVHNAAVRRMVKEWAKHLWVRWRLEHGLSVTKPISSRTR